MSSDASFASFEFFFLFCLGGSSSSLGEDALETTLFVVTRFLGAAFRPLLFKVTPFSGSIPPFLAPFKVGAVEDCVRVARASTSCACTKVSGYTRRVDALLQYHGDFCVFCGTLRGTRVPVSDISFSRFEEEPATAFL